MGLLLGSNERQLCVGMMEACLCAFFTDGFVIIAC